MTIPPEYQRANDFFHQLLADARDEADLNTVNQSYTMVQGVFQAFRRRLSLADAIRFANVLPVGARALFVQDWDVDEAKRPVEERTVMTAEVQELRPQHNYAPENAIRAVARALRRNLDEAAFDRMLATLPPGAAEFWAP